MIADIQKYIKNIKSAVFKHTQMAEDVSRDPYFFPIQRPIIPVGVVPKGRTAAVLAADSTTSYDIASQMYPGSGFPGFPYLAMLATRAEFRAFAQAMSIEITREWIEFTSSQDDGSDSADKIGAIEAAFKNLKIREIIRKAAEQDCLYGGAQIIFDIQGAEKDKPLILDPRTIEKGSLKRVVPVEPIWTTPSSYNAIDPSAPDFYRPSKWFVLGQEIHASRIMTIITREVPDILKPAFNFMGISLSQLAEPYVNNWLRTRQSVSDLINNFSITALQTSMDAVLQGDDDGSGVIARAQLFTATRSNQGLMLLDKDNEELVQINVPIAGLHELQSQAQEQMCSVSHMPAVVLTGIAPSGFGNVAEGEMSAWRDWVAAQQEAYWRSPIETILKVVQLSLFGEIDPDINFTFCPLYQLSESEQSDIRMKNAQSAQIYIDSGVIAPEEERQRLADDPDSGYQGLDMSVEIEPPMGPPEGETDPAEQASAEDEAFKKDSSTYDNLIIAAGGSPDDFDHEQFAKGLKVEQEHYLTSGGDETLVAGIVLDHLREIPDYYDRLEEMEGDAE